MIGTFLQNRYRLDAELGHGGMGTVYRASDTLLDRPVALKVLSQPDLDAAAHARLLGEAQTAARLNHTNIVAVYDAGEVADQPYIVMELVEGVSLRDHPPRDIELTLVVARQICSALAYAHSHGVVHGDLKPENGIVSTAGNIKLMDFGFTRPLADQFAQHHELIATVAYLAPEQALGQALDPRTDLYALGVMLYEMTTGRLPFVADDALAVISQHLYAPITPPRAHNEHIPPALDALIVQLLSKKPEDRPASAQEVWQALEWLDKTEPGAHPVRELSLLDRIVRGRLVGRERELADMNECWQRACSGEAQVLLLSGEPGIGKTRLVREFATRVEVLGGRVLNGECYAEGGAPYAPIAQMVRGVDALNPERLASLPQLVLADLLTLAPDLRSRHPDIPLNPALDPQSEQQRVYESVVFWLDSLVEQAPLLLFLDDVHWVDNGTLSLLRHIIRRLRDRRFAILLTYREAELDEVRARQELLNDLNRERRAIRIKLSRLTREQTRALLAALFAEDIAPEFLAGIYRETEGNPFFVEEVCKALIDSGQLRFANGRWQRPSMAELEIPQSVRAVTQSRVSRLPEDVQDTLRLAAILGREFDYTVLKAMSALSDEALLEALERAEQAQLIGEVERSGTERFVFAHALIPSILCGSVSGLRRHRLHRRAAAALEAQRPDDYEALAYHHGEAGDDEQARRYYIQAGDRARRLVALDDAAQHYREALHYWPETDSAGQAEILHKLGECQWVTGDLQGAIETLQTAYDLFAALGNRVKAGEMLRMLGRIYWELADRRAAMEHYQRALAILEHGPETVELARAISAISQAHMIMIDFDQAIQWGERALILAERLGADDVVVHALNNIGTSRTLVYDYDQEQGLSMLQASLDRARELGLPYEVGRACYNRSESLFGLGRYAEARQMFEELYAYGTRIHSTLFTGLGLRLLIELDWNVGRWAAALARQPEALDVAGGTVTVWQGTIFAQMNNDLGRPENARYDMENMLAQIVKLDQIQTLVPCLEQLARAYSGLGLTSEAARTIQQYLSLIDRNPHLHWVCAMPILFACRWYTTRATPEASAAAQACLQRLERAHAQMRSPRTAAALAEAQAAVAAAAGDFAQAGDKYHAAIAAWEALGHAYDGARALNDLSRVLLKTRSIDAACAAIDRARHITDELAAQFINQEYRHFFQNSPLVQELRAALAQLVTAS